MRKGITPIIATVILLLITVALAGAAWSFLQGIFFSNISKSFVIPAGGAYCVSDKIIVYVVNTGYNAPLEQADFSLLEIDGNPITPTFASIPVGKSGKAVEVQCTVGACTENGGSGSGDFSGYHSVDLGTISTIQHLSVFCS
ncbi:MAG: hypothetical protein HY369_00795 [Candidatus Aenigmarchaeota archaeon]|nr:hypothetical protein [Candidatus Aenigmarchaeota archaeon]